MKESILLIPDINKSCVQPLYYLFNGTQVNITYCKLTASQIFMEFDKLFVPKKSYATSVLSSTNNKFVTQNFKIYLTPALSTEEGENELMVKLLLLMSILSQTLLAFVSSHLMLLSFLTTWHNALVLPLA